MTESHRLFLLKKTESAVIPPALHGLPAPLGPQNGAPQKALGHQSKALHLSSKAALPHAGLGGLIAPLSLLPQEEEETVDLNMILEFSKALTDSERERYIDVTLGNDQVTLKRRIWLVCKVIPVSFSGSGILPGSCYQLRSAETEKNKKAVIDEASSFTAFYNVRSFIPGNYDSRKIVWKKDGMEEGLPVGTSIIMTERSEERSTTDFWYYKVQEKVSRIDLNKFTRMSGDEEYSYDMESTEYNSLDYQFMADFEESEEKAEEGLYQLGFIASDSSEEVKVCQMELEVQVVPGKTYDLEIRESEEREETPKVTVTCKTEDPTVIITCKAEDPREEIAQKEKTFALVLTGTGETELPEDARLKVGKREYRTSGKDSFILPLGDMQNENSNWKLTLLSDLFPEEEKEYDRNTAMNTIKMVKKLGFRIEREE